MTAVNLLDPEDPLEVLRRARERLAGDQGEPDPLATLQRARQSLAVPTAPSLAVPPPVAPISSPRPSVGLGVHRAIEMSRPAAVVEEPMVVPPPRRQLTAADVVAPADATRAALRSEADLAVTRDANAQQAAIQARRATLTTGQRFQEAANSFMQGIVGLPAQALQGVALLAAELDDVMDSDGGGLGVHQATRMARGEAPAGPPKETREAGDYATARAGRAIQDWAARTFPTDPEMQGAFLENVLPQAFGSAVAFMGGGVAARALRGSSAATAGAGGALAEGGGTYEEARQAGAPEPTARKAGLAALPLGAIEAIPAERQLNRLLRARPGSIGRAGAAGGLEEAAQESVQAVGGNVIARESYDPDRPLFEGVGPSAGAGFIVGLVLGSGAAGINRVMRGQDPGEGSPRGEAPGDRSGGPMAGVVTPEVEAEVAQQDAFLAAHGLTRAQAQAMSDEQLVALGKAYDQWRQTPAEPNPEDVLARVRQATAETTSAPPAPEPAPAGPATAPAPTEVPGVMQRVRRRAAELVDPSVRTEMQEAFRDPMTGLANQTAFERARPRLDADPNVEIAALDVRGLKAVNDKVGREQADAYLAELGRVAREVAPQFGIPDRDVFRAGGDEVAIAGPQGQAEAAARMVSERMGLRPVGDTEFQVGVRVGVGSTWFDADAAAQAAKKLEAGPRYRTLGEQVTPTTSEVPTNPELVVPETALSRIVSVPASDLDLDPERFQFKSAETTKIEQWNPELAGIVAAWRDPADGRLKVVNGHARVGSAKQLNVTDPIDVRVVEAASAEEARSKGALLNIAENRATAVDVAKFLRDKGITADQLAAYGIPKVPAATEGTALARLAPDLFQQVATGKVKSSWGVAIGEILEDADLQREVLAAARKRPRLSGAEVREIAQQVRDAPSVDATQETLFGTETQRHSLWADKAQLAVAVKKRLGEDRTIFRGLADEARAAKMTRAGNTRIDVEAAQRIVEQANQVESVFNALYTRSGPIADIVTQGAQRIANGEATGTVARDLYPAIADAVRAELGRGEGSVSEEPGRGLPRNAGSRSVEEDADVEEKPVTDGPEPGAPADDAALQDDLFGGPPTLAGQEQSELLPETAGVPVARLRDEPIQPDEMARVRSERTEPEGERPDSLFPPDEIQGRVDRARDQVRRERVRAAEGGVVDGQTIDATEVTMDAAAAAGRLRQAEQRLRDAEAAAGTDQAAEETVRRAAQDVVEKEGIELLPPRQGQGGFVDLRLITQAVVRWARRNLTARGHLPESTFEAKIKRDGWFNSQMQQTGNTMQDFRKASREVYGLTGPSTDELRAVDAVLKGGDPATIPAAMRPIVARMRGEIDALSQRMIDEGVIEGKLVGTVTDNFGVYATRSYRVFEDPAWASKVDPLVRTKAKALLRAEYPAKTDDEIEGLIDYLLYKTDDSPIAILAQGRLGSKDLSILTQRKEIAPEIRELWGEYENPRVNYTRSVAKMAQLIANHQFLETVRSEGLGVFFFEEPTKGFHVQFASQGSKVMEPLNGLYTSPEIAQAFHDAVGEQVHGMAFRLYMKANAATKFSKTVLSAMTHVRNLIGNTGFALANGHWRLSEGGTALKATFASLRVMKADKWRTYYRRLQELGVVHESIHAGELRDAIDDAMVQSPEDVVGSRVTRAAKGVVRGFAAVYHAEDAVWKVYAFENEMARYRKALPNATQAEVEQRVAEIVRNTYPTYSLVPRAVRLIRRVPLIGPFVSFPSEVFRTLYHSINLTQQELRDPALAGIGAQRLVGLMLAAGGVSAMTLASRLLTGHTDDDDDAMREFLPPWSEHSDLVYLDNTPDGKARVIDLSYSDPYSYLRTPLRAMLRGEDWVAALRDGMIEAASPFLSEEILAGKLLDLARNQTRDGRRVWNPESDPIAQAEAMLAHLYDALEPGTISSARRIADGIGPARPSAVDRDARVEALAVFTGQRVMEVDVPRSLMFRARELEQALRDANAITLGAMRRQESDEERQKAEQQTGRRRDALLSQATRMVRAAETLGVARAEVVDALDRGGLSSGIIRQILDGRYYPYRPSDQFLESIGERQPSTTRPAAPTGPRISSPRPPRSPFN